MAPTTEKFTPDRVVMASKAGSSETANDCTPEDAAAAALQKTSRISSTLTVLVAGLALFSDGSESTLAIILATVLFGALFGMIFALVGFALTRGQRDFSSVTAVVATKYEVLVEHRSAAQARELLASLPGGLPDPFAP